MDVISLAKKSLMAHEGFRGKPYQCTAGKTTIAYGRNLDDKPLTPAEGMFLLENDIVECLRDLSTFSYWWNLTDRQQAGLIDLRYNLGPQGYRAFKLMNKALEIGDYTEAKYQIMNSTYAKQVGQRAQNVADMVGGTS